jgi:tRNA G18 (ribose-2'-O)-methylase SpoU
MTIEYLYRRNTVLEALRGIRRQIHRLWLKKGGGDVKAFQKAARQRGIPIEEGQKDQLTKLAVVYSL